MDISEHSFKGRNDCMSLLFVAVQFGKLLSARQDFFLGGGKGVKFVTKMAQV